MFTVYNLDIERQATTQAKLNGVNMKNLLLILAILGTIQFNVQASNFLNSFSANGAATSTIYDMASLKVELESTNVSCFTYKRKVFVSKGYTTKFGKTKAHCTAKRAKIDGVTRITKDNLTTNAFMAINKLI